MYFSKAEMFKCKLNFHLFNRCGEEQINLLKRLFIHKQAVYKKLAFRMQFVKQLLGLNHSAISNNIKSLTKKCE